MKIYHNSRCSKSRCALGYLEDEGVAFEVVNYLEETPSKEELRDILKKLGIKAEELIRKGEQDFKDNFKGKSLSEEEWIEAMVNYPKLIERPIIVDGDKAVIGRPPEEVFKLIKK